MDRLQGTVLHRLLTTPRPEGTLAAVADTATLQTAPACAPDVFSPTLPTPIPAAPAQEAPETFTAPTTPVTPTPGASEAPEAKRSPLQQAYDVHAQTVEQIVGFSQRSSMASSTEVIDHIGGMTAAIEQLEAISQRLEREGQGASEANQQVEHLLADLAQATMPFQEMLNGALNTETSTMLYRSGLQNQLTMEMAQFSTQNAQARQGILSRASMARNGYGGGTYGGYTSPAGYGAAGMSGVGYGAPGMGAMGYGAPGMGQVGYGAPGMGAVGYGAPGMGAVGYATTPYGGAVNGAAGYVSAPGAAGYVGYGSPAYGINAPVGTYGAAVAAGVNPAYMGGARPYPC